MDTHAHKHKKGRFNRIYVYVAHNGEGGQLIVLPLGQQKAYLKPAR